MSHRSVALACSLSLWLQVDPLDLLERAGAGDLGPLSLAPALQQGVDVVLVVVQGRVGKGRGCVPRVDVQRPAQLRM